MSDCRSKFWPGFAVGGALVFVALFLLVTLVVIELNRQTDRYIAQGFFEHDGKLYAVKRTVQP